jgi:hypothetical protein
LSRPISNYFTVLATIISSGKRDNQKPYLDRRTDMQINGQQKKGKQEN